MTTDPTWLQVRVQQLEAALAEIEDVAGSPLSFWPTHEEALADIEKIAMGVRSVPPSPAAEAHNMRELQGTEDD